MKNCNWCGEDFEPSVSYQIYCSVACREEATKEKINERYRLKRRNRIAQKKRFCSQCGTPLSVYNLEPLCGSCVIDKKQVDKALKELKGLIEYERFED